MAKPRKRFSRKQVVLPAALLDVYDLKVHHQTPKLKEWQKAANPEIIVEIICDSFYWKTKGKPWGMPDGIEEMQKAISLCKQENSYFDEKEIAEIVLDKLKQIALDRKDHEGLLNSLFKLRKTHTKNLYAILLNHPKTWSTDKRFQELYNDWTQFQTPKISNEPTSSVDLESKETEEASQEPPSDLELDMDVDENEIIMEPLPSTDTDSKENDVHLGSETSIINNNLKRKLLNQSGLESNDKDYKSLFKLMYLNRLQKSLDNPDEDKQKSSKTSSLTSSHPKKR